MNNSQKNSQGSFPIISVALAVVALVVGIFVVKAAMAEPSEAKSVSVLCALREDADSPLLDTSQSNTRESLAESMQKRADALKASADKTGGEIHTALVTYATAMTKMAEAIKADKNGASFADAITAISKDPQITAAQKTLTTILDTRC